MSDAEDVASPSQSSSPSKLNPQLTDSMRSRFYEERGEDSGSEEDESKLQALEALQHAEQDVLLLQQRLQEKESQLVQVQEALLSYEEELNEVRRSDEEEETAENAPACTPPAAKSLHQLLCTMHDFDPDSPNFAARLRPMVSSIHGMLTPGKAPAATEGGTPRAPVTPRGSRPPPLSPRVLSNASPAHPASNGLEYRNMFPSQASAHMCASPTPRLVYSAGEIPFDAGSTMYGGLPQFQRVGLTMLTEMHTAMQNAARHIVARRTSAAERGDLGAPNTEAGPAPAPLEQHPATPREDGGAMTPRTPKLDDATIQALAVRRGAEDVEAGEAEQALYAAMHMASDLSSMVQALSSAEGVRLGGMGSGQSEQGSRNLVAEAMSMLTTGEVSLELAADQQIMAIGDLKEAKSQLLQTRHALRFAASEAEKSDRRCEETLDMVMELQQRLRKMEHELQHSRGAKAHQMHHKIAQELGRKVVDLQENFQEMGDELVSAKLEIAELNEINMLKDMTIAKLLKNPDRALVSAQKSVNRARRLTPSSGSDSAGTTVAQPPVSKGWFWGSRAGSSNGAATSKPTGST